MARAAASALDFMVTGCIALAWVTAGFMKMNSAWLTELCAMKAVPDHAPEFHSSTRGTVIMRLGSDAPPAANRWHPP